MQVAVGRNYLAELFCKIAYVETDFYHTEVASVPPPFDVPDVLLHMSTTRSAKQWLPEYWREIIGWCARRGLSVGLIGGKPQVERERYHAEVALGHTFGVDPAQFHRQSPFRTLLHHYPSERLLQHAPGPGAASGSKSGPLLNVDHG